ncbi:MAG: helix-turn-helix transcriptional regulator [Chitinophagaceae bacterium]|nr:helix-turn-helix transcriptional regulator [Chitinophagaceae bacterium]
MLYQVYPPSEDLQDFIKCFWTLEDEPVQQPVTQRVVPDGCMEMIFHYGDLYRQHFADGSTILQPRSFIFGQITNYIEISPTGRSGIVAARFHPEGLAPFLNVPAAKLENKAFSLVEVLGEKAMYLESQVLNSGSNTERMKIIEAFLLCYLSEPATIDEVTKNCVDVIFKSQGQLDVSELAGKMNINRRNIERRFTTAIGMSPKQLSRAVRLQSTIRMLEAQNFTSLTSLAYENGYYDQAHFIRDFKEFTGMSPKSFFADNLMYASLFATAQ